MQAPKCAASSLNVNGTLPNQLGAATKAINEEPNLPPGYAARTTHTGIPPKDSLDVWRNLEKNRNRLRWNIAFGAIKSAGCGAQHEDEYDKFDDAVTKLRQKTIALIT